MRERFSLLLVTIAFKSYSILDYNVIRIYCFIPNRITNITTTTCSLKLECEKLASEKVEIQRHYVMVSSYQKTCRVYYLLHVSLEKINPQCRLFLKAHYY